MCGFYCIAFIKYMLAGKTLLDYINLRKIDETRNYLLDEIKHNDLMSENYKKT